MGHAWVCLVFVAASRSWLLRSVADSSLVKPQCLVFLALLCLHLQYLSWFLDILLCFFSLSPSFAFQLLVFLVVYTEAQRFGFTSAES